MFIRFVNTGKRFSINTLRSAFPPYQPLPPLSFPIQMIRTASFKVDHGGSLRPSIQGHTMHRRLPCDLRVRATEVYPPWDVRKI